MFIYEVVSKAKFYWNSDLVRAISQSYHIGYLASLMPAGLLVDLYGARQVWAAGLLLACIMTFLLPSLANLGPYSLIFGLILLGFGQVVGFLHIYTIGKLNIFMLYTCLMFAKTAGFLHLRTSSKELPNCLQVNLPHCI